MAVLWQLPRVHHGSEQGMDCFRTLASSRQRYPHNPWTHPSGSYFNSRSCVLLGNSLSHAARFSVLLSSVTLLCSQEGPLRSSTDQLQSYSIPSKWPAPQPVSERASETTEVRVPRSLGLQSTCFALSVIPLDLQGPAPVVVAEVVGPWVAFYTQHFEAKLG